MEENQLEQAYAAPLRAILDRVGATDIEQLAWQFNFSLAGAKFRLWFDDGIELSRVDDNDYTSSPFYVPLEQATAHEKELERRLIAHKNGEQPKNPYHHY